jgi:hypothetical protein
MVGNTSCGFDVRVDSTSISPDRAAKINGGAIMDGDWSRRWFELVDVMRPEEHLSLTPGDDRYEEFCIWEKHANAVERALVYHAFADTPEVEDPTWLWVEYGHKLPASMSCEINLAFGPYEKSILLFQEPGGAYQVFFPESVYLAQHQDMDCVTRYYSSAQGVDLTLVWGATFLSYQYAGVKV